MNFSVIPEVAPSILQTYVNVGYFDTKMLSLILDKYNDTN
jgi:hypothetical protein